MTGPETKPFKSEMRLIIQASIPIEDPDEGEELYAQLKEMISNYSEKSTVNGQLIKLLEPCCTERSANANPQNNPKVS